MSANFSYKLRIQTVDALEPAVLRYDWFGNYAERVSLCDLLTPLGF